MAAITIETSFAAMSRDMGSSHIKAHAGQHKYLMDGEDPVDYLLPNNEVTLIVDQAIQTGVRTGQLRSEEEWKEYNQGIRRKDRRLNSYKDYVRKTYSSASKKVYRDLDKSLQNPKTPKSKKSLIATEYASLASHEDLPIIGSLYYFGDADEFEMAKQDGCFEQLKKADKDAGDIFFQSREFKCLHPQVFKLERHNDELGRPHLQSMEACFTTHYRNYKTKSSTVRKRIDGYGKTQYQMTGLIKYFGSKEKVDQQLDRLIELQQQSKDKIKKNNGKRIGLERPETSMLMDNFDQQEAKRLSTKIQQDVKPKSLERLRRQTIAQLTRVVDFSAMAKAKTTAYKKEKLPPKYYQTTIAYTTNGEHLSADQYRLKMHAKDQGKTTVDKAKAVAEQTKKAAQSDADDIVKAAKKKAKGIVDEAKTKQAEVEQAKNESLYDKAKVDHQVHVAELRLADLNKQANDKEEKLKQQQQQLKQNQAQLKKEQVQHEKLISENNNLAAEIKANKPMVRNIHNLQTRAKVEGLSINEVINDRSKLIDKLHFIGKAYAVMAKTAKIAVAFMTGIPIGYSNEHNYQQNSITRASTAGKDLETYEKSNDNTKKTMSNVPIILVKKAGQWLEKVFKDNFYYSPFIDEQTNNTTVTFKQHQSQSADERTPE